MDPGRPAAASTLDSDHDGLTDGFEVSLGLDPNDPDSDHNGFTDSDKDGARAGPSPVSAVSPSPSPVPASSAPPVSSAPPASSILPTSAVVPVPAPSPAAPSSAPVSCVPAVTVPGADTRTPQFGAGRWIAVDTAAVWPITTDPQATQALSTAAQVKVTAGTAAVLDSKQLQLTDAATARESWLVYVGAFTSWDSANCFYQHQTWRMFCVPYSAAPAIPAASSARRS